MLLECAFCGVRLGEVSLDLPVWELSAEQKAGVYDGYVRLAECPLSPVCLDCLGRERARQAQGKLRAIRRWTLKHRPEGAGYFAVAEMFTVETMGRARA
jgi:hypothetical protein